MKTLHTAYRVTDLAASLVFYSALGYQEVGRIDIGGGASLTVLKFPGEDVGTLELVHRPADGSVDIGTGFSHLVVQVDNLASSIEALSQSGLRPDPAVSDPLRHYRRCRIGREFVPGVARWANQHPLTGITSRYGSSPR
jgi:catechol 2,3-dioxygenase-like lactoylglutathione lyase family enzyme